MNKKSKIKLIVSFIIYSSPLSNTQEKPYAYTTTQFDGDLNNKVSESLSEITLSAINEKSINTENHPYLIKVYKEKNAQLTDLNPSSATMNSLPLNSLTSAKSDDKALTSFSAVGGWIIKTIIPENSFGGNNEVLKKSESLLKSTIFSSLAKDANLPLLMPLDAYFTKNPLDSRNSLTSIRIFSSSRNLGKFDKMFTPDSLRSMFQGLPNHLLSNARVTFQNLFKTFTSGNQLTYITNQDSGSFKSRFSMTDFSIGNDVLAYFDSHISQIDNFLYKAFENE